MEKQLSAGRGLASTAGLAMGLLLLTATAWGSTPAQTRDSCVDCHSDSRFLVQNKKLYDYYASWRHSVHKQEGVACVDCHGGNPAVPDRETAHRGTAMSASDPASPINYRNVPATCGHCHTKEYQSYQQSKHFKHLQVEQTEQQGPNCVTCHGSVNISVLDVNTVRNSCQRCHNTQTGIYPEVPGDAEEALSRFLSIHRYYRFIAMTADPREIKARFQDIDPRVKLVEADWHSFDLDKVSQDTQDLIEYLKAQRESISKEHAQTPPAQK